jgi:hypothetical protein
MQVIQRVTPPAELLRRLQPIKSFFQQYPNLFPSESAMRHFMRIRRAELVKRGLLIETTAGLLVDAPMLADQMVEILQMPVPAELSRAVRKPAAEGVSA